MKPDKDLTESWLHRLMVLFNRPANWPNWSLALASLLQGLTAALIWRLFGGKKKGGAGVALLHGGVSLLDLAVFHLLPRLRVSYGPWKSQWTVLSLARLPATLLVALLRPFLAPVVSGALLVSGHLLGSLLLFYAAALEPSRLRLSQMELKLPGLPPDAPPLRLLQISDLHIERLTRREMDLLQILEETRPDLIVLTGDYLNLSNKHDFRSQEELAELLKQLEAPYGVYAVLGSPPVDTPQALISLFESLPVRLLRHDTIHLDLEHGRRLALIGLDCYHDIQYDAPRLAALAQEAAPNRPRLLLYHSPELMPQAQKSGIDLYLCGHTHGGQVRLPLIGAVLTASKLGKRYEVGHYFENGTHLYISHGVGFEGLSAPRVRFLSPPEVTLFTLRGL